MLIHASHMHHVLKILFPLFMIPHNPSLQLTLEQLKLKGKRWWVLKSQMHYGKRAWSMFINALLMQDTASFSLRPCMVRTTLKEDYKEENPAISPICHRCLSADDTLLHSLALCPKVQTFWISIFRTISEILRDNSSYLDPDPLIPYCCLGGVWGGHKAY